MLRQVQTTKCNTIADHVKHPPLCIALFYLLGQIESRDYLYAISQHRDGRMEGLILCTQQIELRGVVRRCKGNTGPRL